MNATKLQTATTCATRSRILQITANGLVAGASRVFVRGKCTIHIRSLLLDYKKDEHSILDRARKYLHSDIVKMYRGVLMCAFVNTAHLLD